MNLKLLDLVLLKLAFEQRHFDLDHDELLVEVLHLEFVIVEHSFSFPQAFADIGFIKFLLREHDTRKYGPFGFFIDRCLGADLVATVGNLRRRAGCLDLSSDSLVFQLYLPLECSSLATLCLLGIHFRHLRRLLL